MDRLRFTWNKFRLATGVPSFGSVFRGLRFARAIEQLLGAFAYAFMPCSARARLCVESEMPGNLEARLDILEAQGVTILDRRQIYLDEAVDLRRIRAGRYWKIQLLVRTRKSLAAF